MSNNNYLDNCEAFFDKGLYVTPVLAETKRAYLPDWPNLDLEGLTLYEGATFQNKEIGLILGKKSGLIVIDIDTEDVAIQDEIYARLPPLYAGKRGNKKKGINYFFKYNGETTKKRLGVDILSDGSFSVMPPSNHKNGYPYTWEGHCLLDVDLDTIPYLPREDYEWLCDRFPTHNKKTQQNPTGLEPSDGSRCNHGSHNQYSSLAVAKLINDNKGIPETVNELIAHDNEVNNKQSYFLCSSRKWATQDIYTNAFAFVVDVAKNHAKKGAQIAPVSISFMPNDELKKVDEKKFKRMSYPKFNGIGQDMFKYVYANSPIPRTRLSIASVLSTISILVGNKLKLNGVHPNVYVLMLANSGAGKDAPLRFPEHLLNAAKLDEALLGQGMPASDTGVISTLSNQSRRIDIIDEASTFFSALNDSKNQYASKMADVYTTLYTSVGGKFSGKTLGKTGEKIGKCENPYITMLAAMTPTDFRSSFTHRTIDKGLGGRFLYFVDEKRKNSVFFEGRKPIPDNLIKFAQMWNPMKNSTNDTDFDSAKEMAQSESAKAYLRKIHEDYNALKRATDLEDVMTPMINRLYETHLKIAILYSVSCQPLTTNPVMDESHLVWAGRFITAYMHNTKEFIRDNISESHHERDLLKIKKIICDTKTDGITIGQLNKKGRSIAPHARASILKDLIASEEIVASTVKAKNNKEVSTLYGALFVEREGGSL